MTSLPRAFNEAEVIQHYLKLRMVSSKIAEVIRYFPAGSSLELTGPKLLKFARDVRNGGGSIPLFNTLERKWDFTKPFVVLIAL